jgi:hypothetical protein
MLKRVFVFAGMLCALVASADAAVENWNGTDIDIQYWVGSGSNEAVCVVDFRDPETFVGSSYAFGYRWDDGGTTTRPGTSSYVQSNPEVGSNTSEAVLLALAGDGRMTVGYSYHSLYGFSVTDFSYGGEQIVYDWNAGRWLGFWWDGNTDWDDGYGNSGPAEAPDGTFTVAGMGASGRILEDGFLDGWSDELSSSYPAGNTPVIPTPEPATMGLLGLGGLAMLRRHRRK